MKEMDYHPAGKPDHVTSADDVTMTSPTSTRVGGGQTGSVLLYGQPIVSLFIDGKERLCLAQISNSLLKAYSYNEIHNRRVALGITCVQCTPVQLELLRRAGAMPVTSRRCGMITQREAERLVRSFLDDITPPRLPDNFAFDVSHACGWGCRGSFMPGRYNSSRAKCVRCAHCAVFFSPNKFIFHYHRTPDSAYTHPDAANFNSWRRHLKLVEDPEVTSQDSVRFAWEDIKAMFNGGNRKRMLKAALKGISGHYRHHRHHGNSHSRGNKNSSSSLGNQQASVADIVNNNNTTNNNSNISSNIISSDSLPANGSLSFHDSTNQKKARFSSHQSPSALQSTSNASSSNIGNKRDDITHSSISISDINGQQPGVSISPMQPFYPHLYPYQQHQQEAAAMCTAAISLDVLWRQFLTTTTTTSESLVANNNRQFSSPGQQTRLPGWHGYGGDDDDGLLLHKELLMGGRHGDKSKLLPVSQYSAFYSLKPSGGNYFHFNYRALKDGPFSPASDNNKESIPDGGCKTRDGEQMIDSNNPTPIPAPSQMSVHKPKIWNPIFTEIG